MNIFQRIFSIENNKTHKIFNILGIKLKFKNYRITKEDLSLIRDQLLTFCEEKEARTQEQLSREIWLSSQVSQLHSDTFKQYKNINSGKDVVIMASGPSVNNFIPIKNAIYIAVNRSFKRKNIKFNYLFMEDYHAVKDYIDDAKDYDCVKFYGITNHVAIENYRLNPIGDWLIPESISIEHNAKRFYSEAPWLANGIKPVVPFAYNLLAEPLYCYGSIMFPAIQFALWTNPKRIYIVGMDNTDTGYFDGNKQIMSISSEFIKENVLKLKKFANTYYPKTEIISVNPVGLKGVFKDIYTDK